MANYKSNDEDMEDEEEDEEDLEKDEDESEMDEPVKYEPISVVGKKSGPKSKKGRRNGRS